MSKREIARHRWHEAQRRINEMHRAAKLTDLVQNLQAPDLQARLQRMDITKELKGTDAHQALVRFLDFSPDGMFLVTAR